MDRYLDTTQVGPMWLLQPSVAQVVLQCIDTGVHLRHYELHAYVIMSNHVHLLITPQIDPSRLIKSLKGTSAREGNKLLQRTGTPFWQKECYDHWVRDEREFEKIQEYIEENPVKAGLVARAELYPWSSASVAMSGDAARMSACATG